MRKLPPLSEAIKSIKDYGKTDKLTGIKDVDLLILIDKDKITRNDEKRMKYPLYDLEFKTGTIISPIVFSKKDWETRHRITPFYENVKKEGKIL